MKIKDYDSAAISKRSYPLQELNGSISLRFTLLKINIDPINACCIACTHETLTYMRTIKNGCKWIIIRHVLSIIISHQENQNSKWWLKNIFLVRLDCITISLSIFISSSVDSVNPPNYIVHTQPYSSLLV